MVIMPETGFHPTPQEDRNTWKHMWHTFKQGAETIRMRPRLTAIVGVGLFYGLYSEGLDRLWVKHLIDNFDLPILIGSNQVAFFAVLRVASTLLTIVAVRFVEKRVDTGSPLAIGRAMLIVTGLIAGALIGFAVSPLWLTAALALGVCLALFLVIDVLRDVSAPLQTAWINQKLDSNIRATVHSMFGQVDAIGQIAGGPGVGLIARFFSVSAALTASGLLLTPAAFLIRRANRRSESEVESQPEAEPAD
jgi:DHA3 family tetracycline resistance protein-like MFS transporter